MVDLANYIHNYKRIKLHSNKLDYTIGEFDEEEQVYVCTRHKCKSNFVQSFYLSRYADGEEFRETCVVRGQRVTLLR